MKKLYLKNKHDKCHDKTVYIILGVLFVSISVGASIILLNIY